MANVQLSSSIRANLLALQSTAQLMGTTQERLATGRRVNSALDDAAIYFSAQQGFQKADDLAALKSDMGEGLQKVKTAVTALDSVGDILQQMKGLVQQAKATSDTDARTALAQQFDALNSQISDLIGNDANYKGTNLLDGSTSGNDLVINFNEDASSSITIAAADTSGTSYAIVDAANNWADLSDITAAETDLSTASSSYRSLSSTLASQSSFVQTRIDYTQQLTNIFKSGAEDLVAADLNEEGANMLALQTSQQLSVTALSLSSQAAQSILRLF